MNTTGEMVLCAKCGKPFITQGMHKKLMQKFTSGEGGEENQPPRWLWWCPACRKRETGKKLMR